MDPFVWAWKPRESRAANSMVSWLGSENSTGIGQMQEYEGSTSQIK